MNSFEHICYLSDGTALTHSQYEELYTKGKLALEDGRILTVSDNRDYLYSSEIINPVAERGFVS